MHRSGTSVTAHLLQKATGLALLDDPEWAIAESPLFYRNNQSSLESLVQSPIVKCPRMTPFLTEVASDFPNLIPVVVLRDPRDIWASISEAIGSGRPTRIGVFPELGLTGEDYLANFLAALTAYQAGLFQCLKASRPRAILLEYEELFNSPQATVSHLAERLGAPLSAELTHKDVLRQYGPHRHKNEPNQLSGPHNWMHRIDPVAARTISSSAVFDSYLELSASDNRI